MEIVLGVPFVYEVNDEVRKLLEDFRDMVNFCIDFAVNRRITSYATLRKEKKKSKVQNSVTLRLQNKYWNLNRSFWRTCQVSKSK
ncbi:MAG: hypothetical protein QXZ08_03515 [Nitrososphaeria archaeon]